MKVELHFDTIQNFLFFTEELFIVVVADVFKPQVFLSKGSNSI